MDTWEDYLGSRKFQFLADALRLPIDQVNFLLAQVLALVIAYLFRVVLHPSNASAATRHWTALSAGLCISYFCFGKQILLAILLVVMCYCLLILLPPTLFHHATLCASMTFLSAVHIERQIHETGQFAIDITGPLMIIVQKATSLAYSLHDGIIKDDKKLTPLQKKFLVRTKPSALEYFSYLLCFQSILAGPYFMFTDYHDFIEGTHYFQYAAMKKKRIEIESTATSLTHYANGKNSSNNNISETIASSDKVAEGPAIPQMVQEKGPRRTFTKEPNPTVVALQKMFVSFVCALIVILILPLFPIKHLAEPSFLASSTLYKVTYILFATTLSRQLYYTAWFLADAVCSMSGLSFSGFDENGNSHWDLMSNVNLIGVEFGTSLKTTLESWNIGTMKWLRFLVYERAPAQKTVLTYLVSSLWHGFYPGYYLTFLGGAFFTIASRTVRRSIRPRVLALGYRAKKIYDVLTFFVTRLCLSYITFPFVLLRFWASVSVYNCLWYYLHCVGLIAMIFLPIVFPPPRTGSKDDSKSSSKKLNGDIQETAKKEV